MNHIFRRYQGRGSYDLFSVYSYYLPGIKGMFILLALFLLGSLLGNLVVLGLQYGFSEDFAQEYGTLISYPVIFIPAMLYASAQSRRNDGFEPGISLDRSNFGKYRGFGISMVAAAATIALAYVVEPAVTLLPDMPQWLKDTMSNLLEENNVWLTLVSVSVLAPLFEEWLCRGLVLRGLLRKISPAAAISVSAAFFAVLHMNPWQAIPAFAMGMLFGYVYYRTGSLKLTMFMHCVNNTMAVLLSKIPQFKDAETFMDILSPWAYAGIYISLLLVLGSALVIFRSIPPVGTEEEATL